MNKIKKDDLVRVMVGKDKGRDGKVIGIDLKKNKVVVEGCNMVTKHEKPGAANPQGGIVRKERAIDISNVMLLSEGKPVRVGFRIEGGKKVRIAKQTGKVIS